MRKVLLTFSFVLTAWVGISPAFAATLNFSTGGEGGAYHGVYGKAINDKAQAAGLSIKEMLSAGSVENLDRLVAGSATFVLSQGDVAGARTIEDSDFGDAYINLADIGMESLICAVRKDGRVPTFDVLNDDEPPTGGKFVISAGPNASGTYFTVENLRSHLKNFGRNTEMVQVQEGKVYNETAELGRLRSGKRDVVCKVTTPDPLAGEGFVYDVTHDPSFQILQIKDPGIVDAIRDKKGRKVYLIAETVVEGNTLTVWLGQGTKITTLVTPVAVWAAVDSMDAKTLKTLQGVVKSPDLLPANSPQGLAAKLFRDARAKTGL